MKLPEINLEEIEKALKELDAPSITNHKWIAEDGTQCSAWEIRTGKGYTLTGDGGMELIQEAFKKLGNGFKQES